MNHFDIFLISNRYHIKEVQVSAAEKETEKKQVPLRLSRPLCDELTVWAEEDFRSLNGQIEYLLTDAVKKRRSKSTI